MSQRVWVESNDLWDLWSMCYYWWFMEIMFQEIQAKRVIIVSMHDFILHLWYYLKMLHTPPHTQYIPKYWFPYSSMFYIFSWCRFRCSVSTAIVIFEYLHLHSYSWWVLMVRGPMSLIFVLIVDGCLFPVQYESVGDLSQCLLSLMK